MRWFHDPAARPIVQPGREPAVLCSDHASRWHDTEQLYVNVRDSFSCTRDAILETWQTEQKLLVFLIWLP